jgi:hypothetical protein
MKDSTKLILLVIYPLTFIPLIYKGDNNLWVLVSLFIFGISLLLVDIWDKFGEKESKSSEIK